MNRQSKMRKTLFILFASLTFQSNAQNLFPVKLDNCKTERFCLDCGDTKAGYDENEFSKLQDKLNKELNLQGIKGAVKFQVLVDAKGRACVLSHTDQSNNPITLKIIEELNKFKKWTPAVTSGKKEEKSSISLIFVINDNKILGQIERVDMNAFKKSFDNPRSPEIFNKTYVYKNENLNSYYLRLFIDTDTTYLELNKTITDTVISTSQRSYGNWILTKVWYNGIVKWDSNGPMVFTILK